MGGEITENDKIEIDELKQKIRQLKIELRKKPKPEQIIDWSPMKRAQLETERKYKQQLDSYKKDYEQNARKLNVYISYFPHIKNRLFIELIIYK